MKTIAATVLALLALSTAPGAQSSQSFFANWTGRQRSPESSVSSLNRRRPPQRPPINLSCLRKKYRTFGGGCNNVRHQTWGARDQPFCFIAPRRDFPKSYLKSLPSARRVSNIVCRQRFQVPNRRRMSELVTFFGQLIDHTITETGVDKDRPWPIQIPRNDSAFPPGELPFFRTSLTGQGSRRGPRNLLSSYIDAASIYGPTRSSLKSLRSYRNGKINLDRNGFLPRKNGLFISGDVRVNENPLLISLHTLFSREHNRVADEVIAAFPHRNDEEIFQTARRIVDAEMAAIVFYEFVPALTGRQLPRYTGYNDRVHACISNTFSTVGFRVGHTLLNPKIRSINERGRVVNERKLSNSFFNPRAFTEEGMDNLIRGMLRTRTAEVDNSVTPEVRNFLLQSEKSKIRLDLAALNIQRGRDHGIPPYNELRTYYGLRRVRRFSEITSKRSVQFHLWVAYRGNVDRVDPWVGGICEDHKFGSLGSLFGRILLREFRRLRDGDRFYFENSVFSPQEIRRIRTVKRLVGTRELIGNTMQSVIRKNTNIGFVPRNPFFVL